MERKVVLVTGASRGIGRAIALEFAGAGYDVAFCYAKNTEKAEAVRVEIEKRGAKCLCERCDLENENEIADFYTKVIKFFGRIDVLVNNAGVAIDSLFADKTAENFKKTLNINLVGAFLMSKFVGAQMVAQKSGKIINIASTNGLNTYFPMCVDYDASKAGLISLTHNLAMQFAPYVCVNAVAPGFIATESEIGEMDLDFVEQEEQKIFLRRAGTEQDVANLVLFLASDKADFINNEVIRIDGGQYGA